MKACATRPVSKALVSVRAIRLVHDEYERLQQRGPSFRDPLGMSRDGIMMPAANATRRFLAVHAEGGVANDCPGPGAIGFYKHAERIVRDNASGPFVFVRDNCLSGGYIIIGGLCIAPCTKSQSDDAREAVAHQRTS